jgi:hypothetical protein
VLGLVLFAAAAISHAQTYSIDWHTLDGGGGTSTGGPYSITGSIGQPDAGILRGGAFTLEGGFWPGLAVPIPEGPTTLLIQLVGEAVSLSWSPATPGFVLEMTDDLTDSLWTVVPAGNPVTIATTGTAGFYRLRKP